MYGTSELIIVPVLAGIGVFALVGLIWNLTEAYFESRKAADRKDHR